MYFKYFILFSFLTFGLSRFALAENEGSIFLEEGRKLSNQIGEFIDLEDLGYHAGTIVRKKEPGVYRILNIGDSFAYSITRKEYTYSSFIEQNLNRDKKIVEVVNLGVPSIGFPEYMAIYNYWSEKIEHDAVIFNVFLVNDLVDIGISLPHRLLGDSIADRKDLLITYKNLKRVPSPFEVNYSFKDELNIDKRYESQVQFDDETYLRIMKYSVKSYLRSKIPDLQSGYKWVEKFLKKANSISKSGKKVIVSLSPSHLAHSSKWQKKVSDSDNMSIGEIDIFLPGALFFQWKLKFNHEYILIDLTKCMKKYDINDDIFYGTNSHWSLEGNRVAASALSYVISKYWMPNFYVNNNFRCVLDDLRPKNTTYYSELYDTFFLQ